MSANSWIRFALKVVLVFCTLHHLIIIIVQIHLKTLNFLKFLSNVWVRLSIFYQLSMNQSIIQYVGLCVFSLPTPLVMIEKIYILCLIIIIKSDVWTIIHYLWLGHETMVCTVCLSIFLWICDMAGLLRGTFVSWWYLPRIWPSVTDIKHYYCDKLDRICQVGFVSAWHWLASGNSDAYCDVFDVCACVCAVWMVVRTLCVWWKLA